MFQSSYEAIFVARQPIFRADETIWGYELLFRSSQENVARITNESQATSSIIADGFVMATDGIAEKQRILINFPERMLIDDAGFALPKKTCVVEILEHVTPSKEALAAVKRLKEAGYVIAVDDYFGQEELLPFIELADIVKIDVLALDSDPERTRQAVEALPVRNRFLLAEKVEDKETFEALKAQGFHLFQGYFFSKPEVIPGKKLTSNQSTKLQLLSELAKPEFDAKSLAKILQSDPNLSYRLFRYINSVGFSLREKVTSLKRAIDMMGLIQAKQWLYSVVLADLNPVPKLCELSYMSVQRAKFMESLCVLSHMQCKPETMFITGLFSLLDAMLGIDMDEILEKLPLDETVVQTLTGSGDMQDALKLVDNYEHHRWDEVREQLSGCGIELAECDRLYAEAGVWAQKLLSVAAEASGKQ